MHAKINCISNYPIKSYLNFQNLIQDSNWFENFKIYNVFWPQESGSKMSNFHHLFNLWSFGFLYHLNLLKKSFPMAYRTPKTDSQIKSYDRNNFTPRRFSLLSTRLSPLSMNLTSHIAYERKIVTRIQPIKGDSLYPHGDISRSSP